MSMAKNNASVVYMFGEVVNCHPTQHNTLSVTIKLDEATSHPMLATCLAPNTPEKLMALSLGNHVAVHGIITQAIDKHSRRLVMTVFILSVEVTKLSLKTADLIESVDNNNPDLVLEQTNRKGELK